MPRVPRVLAYWRAEQRTIRQGLAAMLVASVASLGAGITLGFITGTLERLPGLMVLLPAAIAARGNIFGALASRLGTSIHAGLFLPSWQRQGLLYQNLYAATVLTLAVSFLAGVLAKTISVAFGVTSISLLDFIVISILGGAMASVVVGSLTVALTAAAQRWGWDLDSVAAPLITAAGDVLTVPAIFAASFTVDLRWVTPSLGGVLIVTALVLSVRGLLTDLDLTRRIVRESLPILTLAASVDLFAGLAVESRLEEFLIFPVLLILIPPILGDAGGLGGILAARLASKLHLGLLTPRRLPGGPALLDFSIVFLFSVVVFPLVGVAADLLAGPLGLGSPGLETVVGISLVAGVMATSVAAMVAYYAAVATYRLGMDPDSHGIPLITASMDFVGVIALIIALLIFGVA